MWVRGVGFPNVHVTPALSIVGRDVESPLPTTRPLSMVVATGSPTSAGVGSMGTVSWVR